MNAPDRNFAVAETLDAALQPQSVAVVGASENPHKIGGRPIAYLQRFGYDGRIYPINPNRAEIQGLAAYATLSALPESPDLAIIAVPGLAAVDAVEACADKGVRVAVIMTSGFGETGAEGKAAQDRMVAIARQAGMRLVGPNTQGIANFAGGAVASFATMFNEIAPQDGPIGIVSQSGAMSVVPYALLRERGIGVRHSHATGNESDLTVADFALAVARDSDVKLLLLYMEAILYPDRLEEAARVARERDLPIVAVKAGRSAAGQAAASSHTGALATEDRVIDAFLEQQGIWRAPDVRSLCNAAELYLKGWRPRTRRLVAISNSGASCVMAADLAEGAGLTLPRFEKSTADRLRTTLPDFASSANPIDLTAALLTNNRLFSDLLPILAEGDAADSYFVSLPIAGRGYDTPGFARDTAAFMAATGKAIAVAQPQSKIAEHFRAEGVPTFRHDSDGIAALGQLAAHSELMRRPAPQPRTLPTVAVPDGEEQFLSEWQSMQLLESHGLPIVPQRLCRSAEEAAASLNVLGGRIVLKGSAASIPHKSEYGLVRLGIAGPTAARSAYQEIAGRLLELKVPHDGVIAAAMIGARRELALGARFDPLFGALVMLGDGGKYVEALRDYSLLRHPFDADAVLRALRRLRIAPLFDGVRGEQPYELEPLALLAVRLGDLVAGAKGAIASVDLNPVMAGTTQGSYLIADALIERGQ
ncbi:MAG: acetate--CoA ligase family protein [Reyranellaceae bacterium]